MKEALEAVKKKTEAWLKNSRIQLLFILGCAGLALVLLADVFLSAPEKTAVQSSPSADAETQVQALEERLTGLLENVAGAGKVRVMVTLEDEGETLYAQNENSSTETDSAGQRQSYAGTHVLLDTDGGEDALVYARIAPQIRGVAVVCDGGADITVVKHITELVSVVLGIASSRVYVTN